MLTLLTGAPGASKSQTAIRRFILDVRKENPTRPIYTNIKGLRADLIQQRVGGDLVLPAPSDWRETPPGSLVIYDEAQQIFPATGKPGAPDDERILRLDTHRHSGHDLVLITQDPALIHHWARKFVGKHVHLLRPNGAEMCAVLEWENRVVTNTDDYFERQKADESTMRMDSTVWDLYDSATIHTHKFAMPKGAKFAIRAGLVILLAGVGFIGWKVHAAKRDAAAAKADHAPVAAIATPAPMSERYTALQTAAQVQPVKGCAASKPGKDANGQFSPGHCRCWDGDWRLLDLDEATCRNLAEGFTPMPLDVGQFAGGGGPAARSVSSASPAVFLPHASGQGAAGEGEAPRAPAASPSGDLVASQGGFGRPLTPHPAEEAHF